MKFWKKIFLYCTLLTMVLINLAGIIIIERIHSNNLNILISEGILNERNLINSLYLSYDTNTVNSKEEYIKSKFFDLIFKNYIYKNDNNIKNIEILSENNEVITSLNKANMEINDELLNVEPSKYNFIITTFNKEKVVTVSSSFKLRDKSYKIILTKSINYAYETRISNYKLFFMLDIFISILLIVGMYIISRHLTKPIVKLADLSIEIANGKYNKRSDYINSKDEVGILSQNFNFMMEVLENKIEELENVNSSKERFINNFTHEIKTPITSIIGYSELLLKSNIDENLKRKSLEYINNEGRRLEKLSSSLMKLILLKENNLDISLVFLRECVYNAINSLSYKIENKSINLHIKMKEKSIMADKDLITILLINFIDNAIKACDTNGNIMIYDSDEKEPDYLLHIKDDGIGISEEELNKIVEPFYMVDKSRGKANNGLGLGLSICSEICRVHKIGFNINSDINKGTTITLTLDMERD